MKKVFLGILVLAVVVCACFAFAACDAADDDFVLSEEGSALEYEEVADGYAVIGIADGCTDTKIVVPSGHNGKPVTEIADSAFKGNETITEVVFPKTIKRIKDWAFDSCKNLQNFLLPDGIEELGEGAFIRCDAVRTVHIPASLEETGKFAFAYDSALESVTADKGLKSIGDYAFYLCSSLASVALPEGLESIGYLALGSCASLTAIDFPDTLVDIGGYAFFDTPIEHIVIPGSVRHIGGEAFSNTATKTLTLSEGLKFIGQYAFAHTAIEEVVIPDSVIDLGMQSFFDCPNLQTVKIGFYCNYVPYAIFACCYKLETVIVPENVYIVDSAFAGCENIKNIFYESDELSSNYSVGEESNDNEKNLYGNKYYCEADFYFYSEQPNTDGAHWHYTAEGKPEIWTA